MKKTRQKPKCSKGYGCGNSCINSKLICRGEVSDEFMERFTAAVKAAKAAGKSNVPELQSSKLSFDSPEVQDLLNPNEDAVKDALRGAPQMTPEEAKGFASWVNGGGRGTIDVGGGRKWMRYRAVNAALHSPESIDEPPREAMQVVADLAVKSLRKPPPVNADSINSEGQFKIDAAKPLQRYLMEPPAELLEKFKTGGTYETDSIMATAYATAGSKKPYVHQFGLNSDATMSINAKLDGTGQGRWVDPAMTSPEKEIDFPPGVKFNVKYAGPLSAHPDLGSNEQLRQQLKDNPGRYYIELDEL